MCIYQEVRHSLSEVVLVTIEIYVVQRFNIVRAITIAFATDGIIPSGSTMLQLVDTFTLSIKIIVHLSRNRGIQWQVVVGVAGEDGEIVVGLILDDWIVPAISNHHSLQFDFVGTRNIFGILLLDVLVDHRPIMAAIRFRSEMETFSAVLRESTHKALECCLS